MKYIECWLFYIKTIRHYLNINNIKYKEDKWWFISVFYISETDYNNILPWLKEIKRINQ